MNCLKIILFFFSMVGLGYTQAFDIVRDGVPQCVIVGDPENEAVRELKKHLDKMTGADFKIYRTSEFDGKIPAIRFEKGVKRTNPEEWSYHTAGKDIVFEGHELYAAAEFLEHELGCRWFTFESEYVPERKTFSLPPMNRSGSPHFLERMVFMPPNGQKMPPEQILRFMRLNKYAYGDSPRFRCSPLLPRSHTFYHLVDPDVWFAKHPEYFSMNAEGKRYRGAEKRMDGQLCLSNPEVARIASEKLLELIRTDRENALRTHTLPPNVYEVSQNDNTSFICLCHECRKISAEEGGEGGLLIRFINKIADRVAKEYPDVSIMTFAYVSTENPPKITRPHPNVIVRITDLYTASDCYRPLTHPFNRKRLELLNDWHKTGCRLSLWDYWNMAIYNGTYFRPPRVETIVDALKADIPLFKRYGIVSYFGEAEAQLYRVMPNFYDLQTWLAYKLLDNPEEDSEKLIAEFMKGHYGPAVKPMTEFLILLREKVAAEPKPMYYLRNSYRGYQTPEFMRTACELLDRARNFTPPDSAYRRRVEKEFLPVFGVILADPSFSAVFDRKKIAEEYRAFRMGQVEPWCYPEELPAIRREIEDELLEIKIPEQFSRSGNRRVLTYAYPSFTNVGNDSESAFGKAQIPGNVNSRTGHVLKKVDSCLPTSFGLYDWETKEAAAIHISDIPQDEKYHWYKVGSFLFGKRTMLWSWWWQVRCDLSNVWTSPDGRDQKCNRYEVWIHVRIAGPAYVKGSKSSNNVFMDQIVLVSCQP